MYVFFQMKKEKTKNDFSAVRSRISSKLVLARATIKGAINSIVAINSIGAINSIIALDVFRMTGLLNLPIFNS